MEINKTYCGDCLTVLSTFPDDSVDCCITSPPYFQQRKYGSGEKEIGWEEDTDKYACVLGDVFDEVRRVLKSTGSLYLNLGNKYEGGRLIPAAWRVADVLSCRRWYLKSDIIYAKRNPMPGSYTNRPISAHEYVFLFTKRKSGYYYDWEAIATEPAESTQRDKRPKGVLRQRVNKKSKYHEDCDATIQGQFQAESERKQDTVGRSDYTGFNDRYTPVDKVRRRDVWWLTVPGNPEKHFAMFNQNLVRLCLLAGCPEDGLVLDPFAGLNTVGLCASQMNRNYIGIELNEKYVDLAKARLGEV